MAATVNLPVTSKAPSVVDKAPTESMSSNGADQRGFSQVLHHQMDKHQAKSTSDSGKVAGKSSDSNKNQAVAKDSPATKQASEDDKPVADQATQQSDKAQLQDKQAQRAKTQQDDQAQADNVDTAIAAAMQTPATPMSQLRELVAASLHKGGQDGNTLPLEANASPAGGSAGSQSEIMKLLALRTASAEAAGQQLKQADTGTSSGLENSGLPQGLQLLEQRIQKQIAMLKQQSAQAPSGDAPENSNIPKLDIKQLQGLENALQSLAKANTKGDSQGLASAWEQLRNRLQELQLSQDGNSKASQTQVSGLAGMLKTLKQEMASLQQGIVPGHAEGNEKAMRLAFQELLGKVSANLQQKPDQSTPQSSNTSSLMSAGLTGSSNVSQTQGQTGQASPPTTTVNVPVQNQAWGQAIGERLQWMVKQDLKHAEIKLNPRHLGPIEVKIAMNQDQATVSFSAHHLVTKEALETAMPRLREMFGDSGLNLVDVNVSHHSGSEGQQANAGSQQGQSGGGGNHPSWSSSDTASNESLVTDARTANWFSSNQMLDTYV